MKIMMFMLTFATLSIQSSFSSCSKANRVNTLFNYLEQKGHQVIKSYDDTIEYAIYQELSDNIEHSENGYQSKVKLYSGSECHDVLIEVINCDLTIGTIRIKSHDCEDQYSNRKYIPSSFRN